MRALKAAPTLQSATGTLSGGGQPAENGAFVLQPKVIPLDWLETRYSVGDNEQARPWGNDDVVRLGDGYTLERKSHGTRQYARHDLLRHTASGTFVAEVWSCPRNEVALRANAVKVKSANETLYGGTWYDTLIALMDGHGWRYRATTKLDVAADGFGFLAPWAAAQRGEIVHGGRSPWKVGNYPGVRGVRNIEVGERNANKFARIYKKEEEILKSGKQYILDYWAKRGLAAEGVQRCELAVKGAELRRYFDDGGREFLDALTDPLARVELFRSLAATFIRFHTGEKRSRDRSDVLAWDWSAIDGKNETRIAPRAPRVLDLSVNAMKVGIRHDYMIHVATGSHMFLSTAQMKAAAMNLLPWLEKNAELFRRDAETLVATGINASTLFDMLQDCDADARASLKALPTAKVERRAKLLREADGARTLSTGSDALPPGHEARYRKWHRRR